MKSERGGIISKLIFIPLGVVLMVGFFFLGYYVGRYQNKSGAQGETAPPLPEMASASGQKQEEFTFYKTLTDKTEKTVSIELKPRQASEENKAAVKQPPAESPKVSAVPPAQREKKADVRNEKKPSSSTSKETVLQKPQALSKKEPPAASSNSKLRYTLQIASYQEKQMAADEVAKMKKRGYAAFIASSELSGKGLWHRVRLGSFLNKAAAEKLQKAIHAKEGISSMIVIE